MYRGKYRQKDMNLSIFGGIEGKYAILVSAGDTRKQIAAKLGVSVFTLEKWITRWNKARKEQDREQVNP